MLGLNKIVKNRLRQVFSKLFNHFQIKDQLYILCSDRSFYKYDFYKYDFGTDYWGGFERKKQKKVHNGSENSENKKKYRVV